jgi:site-specific DNA-methyltransferase (adenine-specific)
VKSGDVRDLKGVLDRDKAQIGALLTLKPPTKAMREEAAAADFYKVGDPEKRFPRIQILTIAELLAGQKLDYPRWAVDETFKKAARKYKEATPQEQEKSYPKLPNSE